MAITVSFPIPTLTTSSANLNKFKQELEIMPTTKEDTTQTKSQNQAQSTEQIYYDIVQKNKANQTTSNGFDPQMPQDLVPSSGNLATERVYYTSVFVLDALADASSNGSSTINLSQSGAIDLAKILSQEKGFTKPAMGVILRSEQSWQTEGVTLGQLLHSIPLSPGESTRIAVTDWSRTTTGQRKEDIAQTEDMKIDTQMKRAVSEVTKAVANETQHGSSTSKNQSDANQWGGGFSYSGGGNLLLASSAYNVGASYSGSKNNSLATSVSKTSGTRNLSSRTNSNITNNTQQQASDSRSRRSAVVQETFEGEGEKLTTRVITNYNHMHALSIQYYEVVQNYRVITKADHYDRCLFLPLKAFDFQDQRILLKYAHILEQFALTKKHQQALRSLTPQLLQPASGKSGTQKTSETAGEVTQAQTSTDTQTQETPTDAPTEDTSVAEDSKVQSESFPTYYATLVLNNASKKELYAIPIPNPRLSKIEFKVVNKEDRVKGYIENRSTWNIKYKDEENIQYDFPLKIKINPEYAPNSYHFYWIEGKYEDFEISLNKEFSLEHNFFW